MPADAKENLILTSLMALFAPIVAGATYLTSPAIAEGPLPDPIPTVDVQPRVYVSHVTTETATPPRSGNHHRWTSRFVAWVCAKDQRTVNRVRKDILTALLNGEATMIAAYKEPAYPVDSDQLQGGVRAGVYLSPQVIEIQYETDHNLE